MGDLSLREPVNDIEIKIESLEQIMTNTDGESWYDVWDAISVLTDLVKDLNERTKQLVQNT